MTRFVAYSCSLFAIKSMIVDLGVQSIAQEVQRRLDKVRLESIRTPLFYVLEALALSHSAHEVDAFRSCISRAWFSYDLRCAGEHVALTSSKVNVIRCCM